MSKAVQQTAVGEGLALGCIALQRESFNGQKTSIELAFRHAWRAWEHSGRFPAVRADNHRDDLLGIIRRSPRRRSAQLSGWATEWPFVPVLADGWEIDDVAELLASQTGVPLSGWESLARLFLERLDAFE
jgi:hypothetical protein